MTTDSHHPSHRLTDRNWLAAQDPFSLFQDWFALAQAHEPEDANAMALSTIDSQGVPNVRMVLLKDFNSFGFVFYTNSTSAKGRELAAQPHAAAVLHWKSLRRQVRFRGGVEQVSTQEADAYFASRHRNSQIGAWASVQSSHLPAREAFDARFAQFSAEFEGKDVQRPPHWCGYRIVPIEIEFWQDRPNRLHDRLQFTRAASDLAWAVSRLYP